MPIRIDDLEFDEGNEDEMAAHRVTAEEVRQVLDERPVFLPNKKGHAAPVVMIGPTFGGRLLTVPLARTNAPTTWRPASAWDSSRGEVTRYHAVRQRER
jgi:hypothetical protein